MTLYIDKFYSPADPFSLPPKRVQDYADKLINTFQKSANKYRGIYSTDDIRFSVFHDIRATANSVKIHAILIDDYTASTEWWKARKEFSNPFNNSLVKNLNYSLFEFSKFSHFHINCMFIEDALRSLIRVLSPGVCNNGTGEFKNIYSHIFSVTTITQYEPLFDILRSIRNSIHNNGVHFNKNGVNSSFTYAGKTFDFVHGKIINVGGWGFLDFWELALFVFVEIDKALNNLFDYVQVKRLPKIVKTF